jgi:Family of unknown function (DUF6152)
MSGFLTLEELKKLKPAETSAFPSPIPTQIVSSDEYFLQAHSKQQREVEARVKAPGLRNGAQAAWGFMRVLIVWAVAIAVGAAWTPAYGHHGASMFDMEHLITVQGTVTSFEWINPHSMIYADAKDDKGNVQKWAIETRGGPNALSRAGWTKETLKPGDEVTFTGHPAKNGTSNMRLVKVTLANGKEMEPESHSWF